jgi:glycosyltransferase involved in cell wall biosynthesis
MVPSGACSVISNSTEGDAYWRAMCGERLQRFVIPNALPLQEIHQVVPASIEKIGAKSGQKIVLYAGRFEHVKNLKNLFKALHQVLREPNVVALFCGKGPLHKNIEGMIVEYGLRDRIFLPGYVMNIWGLMKRADVFVSVSEYEGMPNTVMEAMACGCPVVVSDIPQHRAILDEQSAVFVSPRDPKCIAAGIRQSLEGVGETEARARRAMERAATWTIQQMAKRYEDAYLKILGSNR